MAHNAPQDPADGPAAPYLRADKDGIVVRIRVTTKAKADAIAGPIALDDGSVHLAVKVRAAPEKGAANRAVIGLLAKALKIGKSNLSLIAGQTARLKAIKITGDPRALRAAICALAAAHRRTSPAPSAPSDGRPIPPTR